MSGTIKKACVAGVLLILLCGATSADTIWEEDFSSYTDAGITGAGNSGGYPGSVSNKWSIDVSACANLTPGSGSAADYFMAVDTSGGRMEAVDIDGEAIWTSEPIDISAYSNVSISIDTSETGSSANVLKYVHLFYKLNGGPETAFAINPTSTGNWGSANATQGGLSGSTLQIVARVNNPNSSDKSIFDNVTVSGDPSAPPINTPPILAAIGNQSVTVSNALNFSVSATDIDNDPITLSASNLPPGAVFNTVTNAGTVSNNFNWAVAAPTGTWFTTFFADDGTTNDFETITITVSNAPIVTVAPILTPIGARTVTNGQTLTFQVNASDANNDTLTYTASNLPPGAVFSTNTIPPQFSWSPVGPVGVTTSRFTVADGTTNDFEDVVITVVPVPNAPPILAPIGNQSLTVGDALNFTVSATDANGENITLSASNLPPGAVFNTVTNAGTVSNSFSWAVAAPVATYTPTFYAADGTTNVSESITITVSEPEILLISEVADPEDIYKARFVELYNAGSTAIDLAGGNWHLSKQVNGGTWYDVPLIGTVAAEQTFVAAYDTAEFQAAYGFAPDLENGNVSGNGDDAYFLYSGGDHTTGTLVDIYGAIDTDGAGTDWDYEDSRAVRNNDVLEPNTTWTASEWTITPNATTADMTPGAHGPAPEFQGLENQFIFLTDDLNLIVTAVNTVKTDTITLSATNLPGDATFPEAVGTNAVSSTLFWETPPAGTYTATFDAAGEAGTTTRSIEIIVSATAKIDGKFSGWDPDTIVKLDNGQFWRNIGGAGELLDSPLHNPQVTVTKMFGKYRMVVDDLHYTTVEQINVAVSTPVNDPPGLHKGNVYELSDDTVWEQTSWSDDLTFSTDPATVWRWTENEKTYLRFLDRDNLALGTCEVIASAAPAGPVVTQIDGYFRGWKNERIFVLANGEFWQQIVSDSSMETLYRPDVTLTNYLGTGTWRLYVDGAAAPGYVEVQQLTNVTRTAIDGTFYGFGSGEFFKLQNGQWWRQTSLDSSVSTRSNPEVLVWNNTIQMPDEGRSIAAEQLAVIAQNTVTNTFTGLHYANIYILADGQSWMQLSFENIGSSAIDPATMLWSENGQTNLLMRNSIDRTIGSCTVADPWGDADGDGIPNQNELIAGTSLFDRNDFFMIADIRQDTEGRAVLRWVPVSGRTYLIEWTPSLLEPFQPLETLTDWTQDRWTDTINPPGSSGFYRIRVQLAD